MSCLIGCLIHKREEKRGKRVGWRNIKLLKREEKELIGEKWCWTDRKKLKESSNCETLRALCEHIQPIKGRLAKGARLWLAGRYRVMMAGRPSILHFLPLSQPLLPLPGVPYSRRHGRWDTDDESETWCQCCNGLGLKRNQHWLAVGQLSIEDTCVWGGFPEISLLLHRCFKIYRTLTGSESDEFQFNFSDHMRQRCHWRLPSKRRC